MGGIANLALVALLAPPFQDHAVLQRDMPIRLWGTAAPMQTVTVSFAGETASATADSSGAWRATLPAHTAGGPYDLTASSGTASQTLHDVLMGDVYLCSGQSNMELPVHAASNTDSEIAGAANDTIRLLQVPRTSSTAPLAALAPSAKWAAATPATVKDFSAACFYFGRELKKSVDVPLGLIESSWGGSTIQTWIGESGTRAIGGYDKTLAILADYVRDPITARAKWQAMMDGWWHAHDPGTRAPVPWSAPAFDDSGWATMKLGGWWESAPDPALANFDGIVWFRTTVELTPAQAALGATLTLGPVDDIDDTWVNGVHIGGFEGWDQPRLYALPPGTLRPGTNTIAIGVLDTGGGGGLWGTADKRTLTFADGSVVKLAERWRYKIAAALMDTGAAPHAPWSDATGTTLLYNAMIAPLAPYGLRGVLWYQGESNISEPDEYRRLLAGLMADWRRGFEQPELPFLIVQLPNFGLATGAPQPSAWANLREAQRMAVAADRHAALTTIIDIGDRFDIHPTNKQELGRRLALGARHLIYGEAVHAAGPWPVSATRNGVQVSVTFENAPLVVYGAAQPVGFQLCDEKHCEYAGARATADRVTLDVPKRLKPTRVRFCWADSPLCNLYNTDALPAVPFEMAIAQRSASRRRR
jgi:sialate O-acetylesterase